MAVKASRLLKVDITYIHKQILLKKMGKRHYISKVEEIDGSEDDVPADNTEEDQEGKCTREAERNKKQVAVEIGFYGGVYVKVAKLVHEGNYITVANANNVQEPVFMRNGPTFRKLY
jgi:hypothetical protein